MNPNDRNYQQQQQQQQQQRYQQQHHPPQHNEAYLESSPYTGTSSSRYSSSTPAPLSASRSISHTSDAVSASGTPPSASSASSESGVSSYPVTPMDQHASTSAHGSAFSSIPSTAAPSNNAPSSIPYNRPAAASSSVHAPLIQQSHSHSQQQHQQPAATNDIKQRRVAQTNAQHDSAAASASSSSQQPRKILRVAKRHPSTWGSEIKAAFTSVYGVRGPKNKCYYPKILLTVLVMLALLAYIAMRPPRTHLVVDPLGKQTLAGQENVGVLSGVVNRFWAMRENKLKEQEKGMFVTEEEVETKQLSPSSSSPSTLPPLTNADITIFTVYTPEPSTVATPGHPASGNGESHNLHLRAIYSWLLHLPSPTQVHVYVRSYDDCTTLLTLGVVCRVSSMCWNDIIQHMNDAEEDRDEARMGFSHRGNSTRNNSTNNNYNVPLLTCLFSEASRRTTTEIMMYLDNHMLLFQDIFETIKHIGRTMPQEEPYLLIGKSQPLTLNLDMNLDLITWQKDLESAIFLDSSEEKQSDLLGQSLLEQRQHTNIDSKSIHYLIFKRNSFDIEKLPNHILMDTGIYLEHSWESLLVGMLLVSNEVEVIDISSSVTVIEFAHHDSSNHSLEMNEYNQVYGDNYTHVSELHPNIKSKQILQHLSLGRRENAHYTVTGKCPTCVLKENRESDLPLILLRHANAHAQIIVIATNTEYLSLTMNWICRAQSLNITNYILLAEDRVSYRILRKMDQAVILRKDAPYKKEASAPGSKEFQETLYLRALFFQQIIHLGFSLIMTHLDTIWLSPNILEMIHSSECDMYVQQEKLATATSVSSSTAASGGLLSIKSNTVGQAFATDYLICEQENWNFISIHGKSRFSFSDDTSIDCIELISTRLMRRNNLRRCQFDTKLYVSENEFFDTQSSQYQGIWPSFVHLNTASGITNKTRSYTSWHLWSVDDDAMVQKPGWEEQNRHGVLKCKNAPGEGKTLRKPGEVRKMSELMSEDHDEVENGGEDGVNGGDSSSSTTSSSLLSTSSPRIHIKIFLLTSPSQYERLQLTLLSLAQAQYSHAESVIDLAVTVQQDEGGAGSDTDAYTRTRTLLSTYTWSSGSKTIHLLPSTHVGLTDSWLDHWKLRKDNDAFIFPLHAGQIVSPYWYLWFEQTVREYYYDTFQYDPRLMSISLVHQLIIPGETPSQRWGSKIPSQVLETTRTVDEVKMKQQALQKTGKNLTTTQLAQQPTTHLYLYQYVPLTGTIFFPRHFSVFLHWYLLQNVTDSTVPCIPTLLTNKLWREKPQQNWDVWLQRFVFEAGWYGMQTNFHGKTVMSNGKEVEGPRALIVDDKPTVGSLSISLLKRLDPTIETSYPPRSSLHLYDFHFREWLLTRDGSIEHLARRKLMLPPLPSSVSMQHVMELEEYWYENKELLSDETEEEESDSENEVDAARKREETIYLTGRLHFGRREDLSSASSDHDNHEAEDAAIEEEDISHLDVMIADMIEEMEERRGAGGAAFESSAFSTQTSADSLKPGMSQLRASASARAKRFKNGRHTHRAHHTRPIRGREKDRCYVVEDAERNGGLLAAAPEAPVDPTSNVPACAQSNTCYQMHDRLKHLITTEYNRDQAAKREALKAAAKAAGQTGVVIPAVPVVDPLAKYTSSSNIDPQELYELLYTYSYPQLALNGALHDSKSYARYILYQPTKPAPFDRHLRGIYFCFIVALLTNRVLLIDLPDFHMMYEFPFEVGHIGSMNTTTSGSWLWSDYSVGLADVHRDYFDLKKVSELRTASLDMLYSNTLLIHQDITSPDRILFKNVIYKSYQTSLFSGMSRMKRTGLITKLLLGRPKERLLLDVQDTMKTLGFPSLPNSGAPVNALATSTTSNNGKTTIAIHIVVPAEKFNKPVTAADPLPGVLGRHWDCVTSFLLSLSLIPENVLIYFTTNKPSSYAFTLARRELGRYGHIVTHPLSSNPNITSGGVSQWNTTSSLVIDEKYNLPMIDPALVSGFILGECDISISSGTTYGIFYAARTNFRNKALIVKLAAPPKKVAAGATPPPVEEDYCGPMHRLDLPLTDDITY